MEISYLWRFCILQGCRVVLSFLRPSGLRVVSLVVAPLSKLCLTRRLESSSSTVARLFRSIISARYIVTLLLLDIWESTLLSDASLYSDLNIGSARVSLRGSHVSHIWSGHPLYCSPNLSIQWIFIRRLFFFSQMVKWSCECDILPGVLLHSWCLRTLRRLQIYLSSAGWDPASSILASRSSFLIHRKKEKIQTGNEFAFSLK